MRESYREGLASHSGPESCAVSREGGSEALTGERAGQPLSRENMLVRGADVLVRGGRQHRVRRKRETCSVPARSKNLCMLGSTSGGNREIPWSPRREGRRGRVGKSIDVRRR